MGKYQCRRCGWTFDPIKGYVRDRRCSRCRSSKLVFIPDFQNPPFESVPVLYTNKSNPIKISENFSYIPVNPYESYQNNPSPRNDEWSTGGKVALGVGIGIGACGILYGLYKAGEYLLERIGVLEKKVDSLYGFQIAHTEESLKKGNYWDNFV